MTDPRGEGDDFARDFFRPHRCVACRKRRKTRAVLRLHHLYGLVIEWRCADCRRWAIERL